MFKVEFNLEELKKYLVPAMFGSEEDGNPEKYDIDFYVDEHDELIITLAEAAHG